MRTFQGAFLDGMRERGYVEGQDLLIEWRWAEGQEAHLLGLAQELARLPVDAIVAVGSAISAARDATTTIPIVFPAHSDPVGSAFVASLARPGGNLTGLSAFNPQIGGKRLELLKETVPALSRLAVLWLASQPPAAGAELRALEQAAQTLDVGLLSLSVRTARDLPPAFGAMASGRADGLITVASPLLTEWRGQLVELATKHRLPSLYPNRENVDEGGLMSYGANVPDLYRRAASYVDKILRGARPADLPVEQPTTFDFVVNLQTARAIGITMPPSVLQQTTDVIQ
jgi:putative ABC transport system substrate-binding protein